MPNYITNKIKINGDKEEVNKVLEFIKIDEGDYGQR